MNNNFWLTQAYNDELTEHVEDIRLSEVLNQDVLRTTIDFMTPNNISMTVEVLETPLVYPVFENKCTFIWVEDKLEMNSDYSYAPSSWAKRNGAIKLRAEADDLETEDWKFLANAVSIPPDCRQKFTAVLWYDKILSNDEESWEEIHTLQKTYIYGYKCHMYPETHVDIWLKYETMKANSSILGARATSKCVTINDCDLT